MANNSGWFSRLGLRRGPSRSTSSNHVRSERCFHTVEALESRELLAVLPAGFQETRVAEGLSTPTDMEFSPDGRLFVLEKGGRVRIVESGVLLAEPFLTISPNTEGERGLLGLAFDPEFENNGYVYIYYTRSGITPANRLSRFTVSNFDDNVADPTSELVLLDDIPVAANIHNGGAMAFGHDGMLYLGIGDGVLTGNVQDLSSLNGKLLRLDMRNYPTIIPSDNPFVGTVGARGEIYALGLRNPFKLDVHPVDGRIWITNTGDASFEEIHEARAGANFGWPLYEGSTDDPAFDDPVYSYPYGSGAAIAGGVFYRGNQFPIEYDGDFFYTDFAQAAIRRIDVDADHHHDDDLEAEHDHELTSSAFASAISFPVDLELSSDGALYVLEIFSGIVTRIEYVGVSAVHTYTVPGIYTARLTVDDGQGATDQSDPITIAVDEHPPAGQINVVPQHPLYHGGDTIQFSATATDDEDGTLSPSAFSWNIVFHHNTHTHPFMGPLEGVASGSFQIPVLGETSSNVWYRINLTVTDSAGLKHESFVDVFPQVTQVTINTSPALPVVILDDQPVSGPVVFDCVAGISRPIEVPLMQYYNGKAYLFNSWSDGGGRSHTISTPSTNTTITAIYEEIDQERVSASYYAAGLYEAVLDRVADTTGLNHQVDALMNRVTRDQLTQGFWKIGEHRRLQINEMYRVFLDRIPSAEEVDYWLAQFQLGINDLDFSVQFLSSSEFVSLLRVQPVHFVGDLFKLALNKVGTPEERQPWIAMLNNGASHAEVVRGILTSAERYNVLIDQFYRDFLGRAPISAELNGDFHAAKGTSIELLARSILGSQEFLTKQVALPVVAALYNDILSRTPSDAEIDYWKTHLFNGVSREIIAQGFLQSSEHLRSFVIDTYTSFLNRVPAESEVSYWLGHLHKGLTQSEAIAYFLISNEYRAAYPDDTAFVNSLYEKLYTRTGDSENVAGWVSSLSSGMSRRGVVTIILNEIEYQSSIVKDAYQRFLNRTAAPSEIQWWRDNLKSAWIRFQKKSTLPDFTMTSCGVIHPRLNLTTGLQSIRPAPRTRRQLGNSGIRLNMLRWWHSTFTIAY
ncbi:HHIP-like protein 1 [Durusdinium trenchii]|uniref:HHIP-like protein 1 n=1 Tax=Durusdinium trenchii TaxID=1381693 RepID=A0ABP0QEM3_9DINO